MSEDLKNTQGQEETQHTPNDISTENDTEKNTGQAAHQAEEEKVSEEAAVSNREEDEIEGDENTYLSSSEEEDEQDAEEREEDEFYGIPVKAYDEMNLEALGEELERLLKAHKVKEIRNHVREIKAEFDTKFGKERAQKKEKFLQSGGNIIDFSYSTPAEKKFNKLYFEYKERRDQYYKEIRKNLQENLERRLSIIEELKSITGVGTDMSTNFKAFKNLQEKWRKAGPVPRNEYKNTWNTYHYHVERFYDFLHLDREFRELDYKHNLEQKLKMIDRAEELAEEKDVNRAFRELQNLHRMWKEDVGPVAHEYSDEIWNKFSAATKKIHENRRAYFAELDQQREENLTHKNKIISQIQQLAEEPITAHRQAQERIKSFKKLREDFFATGRAPQAHIQDTWNNFKQVSKAFNQQKNEFYKNLKKEQKENLDKKLELIKIAEEHKDSDNFEEVTPLMKKIQSDWKKIGFVPRSKSDKIWKKFQAACNHYFNRIHKAQGEKNEEALHNYQQKAALLEEIENLSLSSSSTKQEHLAAIKTQIEKWKQIGNVPYNKRNINKKFNTVLDKLFKQLDINKKEAELLKYENRLQKLENADDDEQIRKEANFIRKKIEYTANEIRTLETNLQFFDVADKNNPLMKSTYEGIDRLKQELQTWKEKLNKLKEL